MNRMSDERASIVDAIRNEPLLMVNPWVELGFIRTLRLLVFLILNPFRAQFLVMVHFRDVIVENIRRDA